MSYLSVQNFKEGLDTRRSKITAPAGTLRRAVNCHVTRGGEIEKAKAWVSKYTLPAGTFGMHGTDNALYVFGSDSNPGVPSGVTYQRLESASGTADMTEIIASESFNGVPYVVAKFDDGNVHHFYNGTRVTAWDSIAPAITTLDTLGTALAALIDASPTASASYNAGTNKITVTGRTNDVGFSIYAETVNQGATGDNAIATAQTQAAGGGLPQINELTLSGTYEAADLWLVYITNSPADSEQEAYAVSGAASGTGGPLLTFETKIYTATQSLLYFSEINAPTVWEGTGSGFINIANQSGGSTTLTALAPYQNYIAVFTRRSVQIWFVDTDPINNRKVQVLDNVGTMASRSAVNFGEIDVFFLSDMGVRSLRARDSSNSANVFDVGTSIDTLVREILAANTEDAVSKACAVIEPTEGRYLLAIGDKVLVYSFFPASKISAWTTYEPGFSVDWWAVRNNALYARAGNTIYLYGGDDGETYDGTEVVIELAHLDAGKPATRKAFKGLDAACDGLWQIEMNLDPKLDVWDDVGAVTDENFSLPSFGLSGQATHIGIRLTSPDTFEDYARLSSLAVHFDALDAD
jgi:hypothetical protein